MARTIVSLLASLDAAKAARARLLDAGFARARIRLAGGVLDTAPFVSQDLPGPEAGASRPTGAAGIVSRMLSDWIMSDRVAAYTRALKRYRTLVLLDVPDDAAAERAAAVLDAVRRETTPHPEYVRDFVDPADTLGRAGMYVLPNAPSGWAGAGRTAHALDPGRPDGLLGDTGGLGTDDFAAGFEPSPAAGDIEPQPGK